MNKILIVCLALLLAGKMTNAQQLFPITINNGGKSSLNGTILLEYGVGGFLVNSISTPTFLYTQDFLQPDAGTTTGPIYINNVVLSGGYVTDNGGSTFTAGNAILEFSLGEVESITLNGGSNMLTQGILQPYINLGALPVTGLQFFARRINKDKVQLNWSTIQEINNAGFTIERKKVNEADYSNEGFVNSSALNGNSIMPLSYSKIDDNNFSGTTLYRLKQQDIDGRFTYSVIRMVNGEINNTVTLKVWPIPSQGDPNVMIQGTAKGLVQVFDMSGKLIQQMIVAENTQQVVKKLKPGSYIIRLAGENNVQQKIIVQ